MTLLELVKLREAVIAKFNELRKTYAENERQIKALTSHNKIINVTCLKLEAKLRELNSQLVDAINAETNGDNIKR